MQESPVRVPCFHFSAEDCVSWCSRCCITGAFGAWGFWRLYRRIARGRADADLRWDRVGARVWYALTTTLLQTRTFRKRPWVSFFHSFIFYGFTFYILVNFVDAVEGYIPVEISSGSWWGAAPSITCSADVLSLLVLVGVVALVVRRFFLPSAPGFSVQSSEHDAA